MKFPFHRVIIVLKLRNIVFLLTRRFMVEGKNVFSPADVLGGTRTSPVRKPGSCMSSGVRDNVTLYSSPRVSHSLRSSSCLLSYICSSNFYSFISTTLHHLIFYTEPIPALNSIQHKVMYTTTDGYIQNAATVITFLSLIAVGPLAVWPDFSCISIDKMELT